MVWILLLAGAARREYQHWHRKLVKEITNNSQMMRAFNLQWNPLDFKYFPKSMQKVILWYKILYFIFLYSLHIFNFYYFFII